MPRAFSRLAHRHHYDLVQIGDTLTYQFEIRDAGGQSRVEVTIGDGQNMIELAFSVDQWNAFTTAAASQLSGDPEDAQTETDPGTPEIAKGVELEEDQIPDLSPDGEQEPEEATPAGSLFD